MMYQYSLISKSLYQLCSLVCYATQPAYALVSAFNNCIVLLQFEPATCPPYESHFRLPIQYPIFITKVRIFARQIFSRQRISKEVL